MRYHEAAAFLLDLRRFRSKAGTESTADLLSHLGEPQRGPTYVQIAGSNGKGSTARMVDAICRATDRDVGLYTSPHLQDVRERITVNGRRIPEARVVEFVERIRDYVTDRAAADDAPTFFETLTALALWHFGEEAVDIAVLEVGIGGRLDATSVIDPTAAAVTSVSLEHTDILGDTVQEIARDKASVAPAAAPLVTAASGDALAAIRDVAPSVLTVGDAESGADVTARYTGRQHGLESGVALSGPDWAVDTAVPLLGPVQARNAGVAAALANQLVDPSPDVLAQGLRNAHWPGRVEVVDRDPIVILDGAHNPAACEALSAAVADFEYDACHLVVGAMHDKDHGGMIAALPNASTVHTCRADTDRAADPAVLARVVEAKGGSASVHSSVPAALESALDAATPSDLVLACGSLSVVAEARPRWTRLDVPLALDTGAEAEVALRDAHVPEPALRSSASDAVSRTVRTRVRPNRARTLVTEFRALGGTAAMSALAADYDEPVAVVLSGGLSRFDRLAARLAERGNGLGPIAAGLRARALEPSEPMSSTDYPWGTGTAVMGVLNVTPDSFHDGGEYDAREDAIERARTMVAEGADIIDVGGESTRPGAEPVPASEEIERVVPVIEGIADLDAFVSVDTRKAAVAEAALEAGADMLNDVSGLEDPEMRFLAAAHDVPIVVMHSIDTPVDPDAQPTYDDVVGNVREELVEPVRRARQAGLGPEQIVIDPGIGFGKTGPESFELLDRLGELRALGCPILVGHSHKSLFEAAGYGPGEREHATVAATAVAAERGADIVRVHDVAENVAAVETVAATQRGARGDGQ
ncbi:MAG: dihydropteroate synthase [Halobacteriaceae archaeon]